MLIETEHFGSGCKYESVLEKITNLMYRKLNTDNFYSTPFNVILSEVEGYPCCPDIHLN